MSVAVAIFLLLVFGGLGVLAGAVVTALAAFLYLSGQMIVVRQSRLGFDETVEAIQKAIPERGWSSPGTMDMNAAMAKHDVQFEPRVKIVSMCQPRYAKNVLTTDRRVACLMPCSIAVWDGDDGNIYVSRVNSGLLGKMFGGNIAKVIGGAVAGDEERILGNIIR